MKKIILAVGLSLLAAGLFAQGTGAAGGTSNGGSQGSAGGVSQLVSQDLSKNFSAKFDEARASFPKEIKISPMDSGVKITKKSIILSPSEEGVTYTVSGYFKGQLVNKTKNTLIKLENAFIETTNGLPSIFGEAKTEISTAQGSVNYVSSSGRSEDKVSAIQCKKNLVLGGSGTLFVKGDVYHGIKADEVKIKGSGQFYIRGTKKGAAIKCQCLSVSEDKTFSAYLFNSKNGVKADETIKISSGNFYLLKNETGFKTNTKKASVSEEHEIRLSGGTIYLSGTKDFYITDKDSFILDGAKVVEL